MKIGIDLTWLKPKKSGGVEIYAKNLIDGFLKLEDKNEYILFLAKDNSKDLMNYFKDDRITFVICNTYAFNVKQHLIWQNLSQYRILRKNNIDFCFFPVYEMPIYKSKKIKCVTTIHDIQAYHYPEYFSKLENIWFNLAWKQVLKNSEKVVAITDYTKKDLMEHFKHKNNIVTIYNPVILQNDRLEDFEELRKKYDIKQNEYYYTLCSMHKHKNLITLVKVMKEIKDKKIEGIPNKLIISGVGGPNKEKLLDEIKSMEVEENILITDFVEEAERNSLIKNSNAFLFPSIFEGFGMPPIEAMHLGARVITTNCTSLPEVTKGKCHYVNDAFSVSDWINEIKNIQNEEPKAISFKEYENTKIARQYLDEFYKVIKKDK